MSDIPANITTKASVDSTLGWLSGQLEFGSDHDWIKVNLASGQTYNFFLSFLVTGSVTTGDSILTLRDAAGAPILTDDDGGVGKNSLLSYAPSVSGTYFLDIGQFAGTQTGTYELFVIRPGVLTTNHLLTDGNDIYTGATNERILGGKGADTITIGLGAGALGEQGNDIIIGNGLGNHISGGLGDDTIYGGSNIDSLIGNSGNDVIFGGDSADAIFGDGGSDILSGDAQSDLITGGLGKDYLTGGTENDRFVFNALADSKRGAARDVVSDFSHIQGDTIQLSSIDAKKGGTDNAFHFIGAHKFHHKAGELHFLHKNGFVLVEGDVNGDGKADFQIEVHGVAALMSGDFDL